MNRSLAGLKTAISWEREKLRKILKIFNNPFPPGMNFESLKHVPFPIRGFRAPSDKLARPPISNHKGELPNSHGRTLIDKP